MTNRGHAQDLTSNTARAYRADWRDFEGWCGTRGFSALPAKPETVALYLADLSARGRSRATLQRRLAAIGHAHRAAGRPSPAGDRLARDIVANAPAHAGEERNARTPLTLGELGTMTEALPDTLAGRRDRALLLVGFGGALRRAELVGIDVERLDFTRDGLVITLDTGRRVGIPYWPTDALCPASATRVWLDAAALFGGPLFRAVNQHGQLADRRLSDRAVALIVKRAARAAGLDPTRYAGDSLRAGLVASERGVEWRWPPRAA